MEFVHFAGMENINKTKYYVYPVSIDVLTAKIILFVTPVLVDTSTIRQQTYAILLEA